MKKDYIHLDREKNLFDVFSDLYTPAIDGCLLAFFEKKKRGTEFPFIAKLYHDIAEYCSRGGKRIRPLLLLLSYLGYGGKSGTLEEVLGIASTLEMMHSFLLIQDDIIDRAKTRRGGKSLHVLCSERYGPLTANRHIGSDVALILADVLAFNAVEIIGAARIPPKIKNEFLKIFAGTYELTAWGQILDSLHSLSKRIEDDHAVAMRISTLKTAYYTICNPLLMGYILSGGSDARERERIREFGLPTGLAFQVRDDILGVFGEKKKTGKSTDSDIREGKRTLLVEYALERLDRGDKKRFITLFLLERKSGRDVKEIKDLIKKSGAQGIAVKRLTEMTDTSRGKLSMLKMKEDQRMILSGLIDLIGTP